MLQSRFGEYWDSDRATYEDELNAWRERTAAAAVVGPAQLRRLARRTVARRTVAATRAQVPPRIALRNAAARVASIRQPA